MPKPPSEYCADNVFVGASFLAPFEAERAVREGYASQLMWGSDYPHIESTWQFSDDADAVPVTRLALRNTFHTIPEPETRAILGGNAIRVFGLDARELTQVAARSTRRPSPSSRSRSTRCRPAPAPSRSGPSGHGADGSEAAVESASPLSPEATRDVELKRLAAPVRAKRTACRTDRRDRAATGRPRPPASRRGSASSSSGPARRRGGRWPSDRRGTTTGRGSGHAR